MTNTRDRLELERLRQEFEFHTHQNLVKKLNHLFEASGKK